MKANRNFYFFCLALAVLLFVPNLLQKGMFVDGVWYAAISKNLAHGIGTFWQPVFTRTMFPGFYEHPPLVFGLQSLFFCALGDGIYVEKLYALVVIVLTLLLIHVLWKQIFREQKSLQAYSYLPMLLWIVHDTTYLYYTNNLLECTQGVFVLLSVIALLNGVQSPSKVRYLYLGSAGMLLFAAFLSKGFIGLYPLIAIGLYAITHKELTFRKTCLYTLVVAGSFFLVAALLYGLNEAARFHLKEYLDSQVWAALQGNRQENMQSHRYNILIKLMESSLLPLTLTLVVSLIGFYKYQVRDWFHYKAHILFFLLLLLFGVLPMMVSKKQASYYLLTVTPYLSVMLALVIVQNKSVLDRLEQSKWFPKVVLVLAVGAVSYSLMNIHAYNRRDRTVLQDMEQMEGHLTENSTIGCVSHSWEIGMYGYFMRYYGVSLDTAAPYQHALLVHDRRLPYDSVHFIPLGLGSQQYELCRARQGR